MTDVKRIQAQATLIRDIAETATGQERDGWTEVAAMLDEFARIKGAALPEQFEDVARHIEMPENLALRLNMTDREKRYRQHALTLLDALRAKEAECVGKHENRESRECFEKAASEFRRERDEGRGKLAQAQKEIKRLNAGWNDALMQRDQISAYFSKVRKDLGAIMGWTSSKPDKVPSVPGLEAQARTIKRLADQAGPEMSNLWKMVSAAVGDGWKSRMTTGSSMAMALCAEIADVKDRLAQAERDKAAMQTECAFLLKTRTELALRVPILEEGVQRYRIAHEEKNVHYRDVADAAVKEWERDHGALVPREGEAQKGQESKAEWLSELDRLAVKVHAILDGTDAGLPGEAELFKELARLHNLRCVVLNGQGEAQVPDAVLGILRLEKLGPTVAGSSPLRDVWIRAEGFHVLRGQVEVLTAIDSAGADIMAAHRDAKPGNVI